MALLDQVNSPQDLRTLSSAELTELADEIRSFLITQVSRTGGHLGPNLGVVELTLAVHRVFDSPHDPIIFDTGHQSYVHKILTGRRDQFGRLRQQGGLAGYPDRAESEHDWVQNSHASTALSWAEGMAKAFRLQGSDRTVVVIVGDGALTGGMAWEALNNIASQPDLPIVIVVNDNGRSYTPTVGGLANHLTRLRTDRRYERALGVVKRGVNGTPVVGRRAYDLLHGVKVGMKDVLAPQGLFNDLGLKYVGPIDGHDEAAVERGLLQARGFGGPVIVHCLTRKGKGFTAAENHDEDNFHSVGQIDELTGAPTSTPQSATWTQTFGAELVSIGARHPEVVAVTAAMLHPVGLGPFAAAFPDRTFDVGIAEQHALVSAAGMAQMGLHPVIALYATFLNRAFDQALMDVALHQLGVTLVLDRAGITGPDGPSHHGMWDLSLLGLVPGARVASPRDEQRLRECLEQAVRVDGALTVLRYSKDPMPEPIPAIRTHGDVDILLEDDHAELLIVGHGQFVPLALDVAHRLGEQGIAVRVADPVWSLPVSEDLAALAAEHRLVVSVEDNLVVGGVGARLAQHLRAREATTTVIEFGVPLEFIAHASRSQALASVGLTAQDVARAVTERYLRSPQESSTDGRTMPDRQAELPASS